VGPKYKRPLTTTPEKFEDFGVAEASSQLVAEPTDLAKWWTTFNDPQLNSLIDRAIRANLDLKIANQRVREARAARGMVAGELWPQIDATASYTRRRESQTVAVVGGGDELYQLGFDARWELDLFGGNRRAWQAARAEVEAFAERQRDVLVTLLGEVATTYIDLRGYQTRLRIANDNLKAQSAAVEIAKARLNAGVASELDVSQAKALLATTKAQVPLIERLLRASAHRLAVLIGQSPLSLNTEFAESAPIPAVPERIATGLPADLLRRRPDVRAAERDLAAATAKIGVAKGEYFPRISLLGGFGFQSPDTDNLLAADSRFWSVGPALRWPIFAAGRIRAGVKVKDSRQKQAMVRYEKTVLIALEDTENAIVTFLNEQIRRRHLAEAVTATRRALELAQDRYLNGLADFLNVVDAQRSLYSIEDQWIQSERTVSVALVALYKALGGGWETERL
jgi:NodT family efflux transporter outer membrane factor (OMF) lipoprotein